MSVHHRKQEPPGGRTAPAVAHGVLERPDAFLLRAVEVVRDRIAELSGRFDEQLIERPAWRRVRNTERAADAVPVVFASFLVLGALEIGQNLAEAPAVGTFVEGPAVVVGLVAADIDHAVDRTGPAQALAARTEYPPVVLCGLRLGFKQPVDRARMHRQQGRGRDVDDHALVGPAGL